MNKNSLIDLILTKQGELQSTRMQESQIRSQEAQISTLPQLGKNDVRGTLENVLPKHLVPTNIGKYESVAWPFSYQVEFDYESTFDFGGGDVPSATYTAGETKVSDFTVGQEASFLLMGVYRHYNLSDLKGKSAPLKFTVKNAQSTRQFNDQEVQLQHVGDKGHPLAFPIPLLIQPNSKLLIEMKSILSADINVELNANEKPKQTLVFYGYRVRSQDVDVVTQLMFG